MKGKEGGGAGIQSHLVPVHGHALALPAELAIRCWRNRSAATLVDLGGALLEGKELLGAEGLVVDLRGRVDQVLEMGAGEEVAEVDEFAVLLVFDVDCSPAVLAAAHSLAVDVDVALTADDGEGNDGLAGSVSFNVFWPGVMHVP